MSPLPFHLKGKLMMSVFYVAVRGEHANQLVSHLHSETEKADICCQRLAACGQEAVNTEASATKADHEMSQIKNSKFHSH